MSESELKKIVKALTEDDPTDAELDRAVHASLKFLAACIDGKTDGASVSDRIQAAQVVLQHASTRHDLLADLLGGATGEDLAAAASLLA